MSLTKPFIGAWMDEAEIAFRNAAEGHLLRAIELGLIPGVKPDSLTLFPTGTSSAVFKIETSAGPRVVKMCHKQEVILREAAFLKAWNTAGVATPGILDIHAPDEQLPVAFVVMEYVDKPILDQALSREEIVTSGTARQMGRTLAAMHSVHGRGFGRPLLEDFSRGEFDSLSEDFERTLGRFRSFLFDNKIIDEKDLESARRAVGMLEQDFTERGMSPSFIHGDFGPYNIFYADPIIVFDPGPRISHPMIDLGLTLLRMLASSSRVAQEEHDEVVAGYAEKTAINEKALVAGMVIQSIHLLYTWNKRGKLEKAARLKDIFKAYQNRV